MNIKPTIITNVRLTPNSSNNANWTNHIQGITINGGTVTTGTQTITDTYIDIPFAINDLVVPTNSTVGVLFSVYLNTSNISDNDILSFFIDADNHGWEADASGSGFASDFGTDISSNNFMIDVDATNSGFVSYPTEVTVDTDFTVTAGAVDENGNVDEDYSANDIELYLESGNGTLSGTGVGQSVGQTLVNGIYTWSDVQYDTAEDFTLHGFIQNVLWNTTSGTITASEGGVGPSSGDVFISELSDDNAGGFDTAYMEIYNNSSEVIDMENSYIERWSSGLYDNYTYTFGSGVTIPANGILIVARGSDQASFETAWGITISSLNASFDQGNNNLYFTTGRSYKLYSPSTRDEIDNTPEVGSGERIVQTSVGVWSSPESSSNSTPGTLDGGQVLPVTLTDFTTAIVQNEFVQISWTTQSESSINSWNLYRATEDDPEQIWLNTQPGTNTTEPTVYSFEDHETVENITYFYYLEAIEYDGTSSFWGPVTALIEGEETPELPHTTFLESNYPNPFNPSTTFYCEIKEGETGEFTIYNTRGQVVQRKTLNAGEHLFEWDGANYGSGVYLYKLETKSYVKTRKMMMIK